MRYTDKLRELMTLDASMNTSEIEGRFRQIAGMLFSKFAIRKGQNLFLFKEIEFYFFNKNHRDIISHPRKSEPLCWYINDFGGIDINFASSIELNNGTRTAKYILDDNAFFGGVLIRQLICRNNLSILNGPWACAELFRTHNAFGFDQDFPILEQLMSEEESNIGNIDNLLNNPKTRLNLLSSKQTPEKKVDNILYSYHRYPDKQGLIASFVEFKDKPYRYVRPD